MAIIQAPDSSGHPVFRNAFQGTILYSIPLVGQRLASILLLSIVTRVLTRDDFGMLSLLEQVGSVLSMLLCGSFSASLGYFYFEMKSESDRSRVVGTAILGSFLLGAAAALLCAPAMPLFERDVFRSQTALRYLPLVLLAMPFDFTGEAFNGWLRVEDRQTVFAGISVLRIVLTTAGIAVLVGVLKFHVMAYLATTLATHLVVATVLVIYLFRKLRPSVSLRLFGRMFWFSAPLGWSLVAMFIINFGDQFVLRHYRSFAEVGIYAIAYRIGLGVALVYSSFHAYWTAQVYGILQREDADWVFARLSTYAILLVSTATLALTLAAKPALRILVAPDFRAAAPLIPIIAAANGIRSIGEFLRNRFLAAGRPGYKAACEWIGLAICLALYFLLIPRYGMWGAATATLGTFLAMGVISIVWTYRMNPYRVETARLLKLGTAAAVVVLLYYAIPVSSLTAQIAWSLSLMALFPAGLWVLRFPTSGERHALVSAVRKLRVQRFTRAADAQS
jgi:O-antigen/teichoic acid export membrane protein